MSANFSRAGLRRGRRRGGGVGHVRGRSRAIVLSPAAVCRALLQRRSAAMACVYKDRHHSSGVQCAGAGPQAAEIRPASYAQRR
jgi:hypothetical protein